MRKQNILGRSTNLIVVELLGLAVDEAFVQVGRQIHQTYFRQSEIGDLHMAQCGDQQVVRFKISV